MINIETSVIDDTRLFTIDGLEYQKGLFKIVYGDIVKTDSGIDFDQITIGLNYIDNDLPIMVKTLVKDITINGNVATDLDELLTSLITLVNFNSGGDTPSNLQSVLQNGSSASGVGFSVQSSNNETTKGKIELDSTGVVLSGQAGGVTIHGHTSGITLDGATYANNIFSKNLVIQNNSAENQNIGAIIGTDVGVEITSVTGVPIKINSKNAITSISGNEAEDNGDLELISTTIIPDTTVALNIVCLEAYYALQTIDTLASLPSITGSEGKKITIVNKSTGACSIFSNNSVDLDIWNSGTKVNELTIAAGEVVRMFNDGESWTVIGIN